jgi:hypothetical protein
MVLLSILQLGYLGVLETVFSNYDFFPFQALLFVVQLSRY